MRHALALAVCLPLCLAGPAAASDESIEKTASAFEQRTVYLDCTP